MRSLYNKHSKVLILIDDQQSFVKYEVKHKYILSLIKSVNSRY